MPNNIEIADELSRIAQLVQTPDATAERDTVVITTPLTLFAEGDVLQARAGPQVYFIADRAYEITSIREAHDTLATSADGCSIQITKLVDTDVPGESELNLITDTAYSGSGRTDTGFDLKGVAINTVTSGTMTNQVSSLRLAAGNRLVWGINGTIASTFISLTTVLRKV